MIGAFSLKGVLFWIIFKFLLVSPGNKVLTIAFCEIIHNGLLAYYVGLEINNIYFKRNGA